MKHWSLTFPDFQISLTWLSILFMHALMLDKAWFLTLLSASKRSGQTQGSILLQRSTGSIKSNVATKTVISQIGQSNNVRQTFECKQCRCSTRCEWILHGPHQSRNKHLSSYLKTNIMNEMDNYLFTCRFC